MVLRVPVCAWHGKVARLKSELAGVVAESEKVKGAGSNTAELQALAAAAADSGSLLRQRLETITRLEGDVTRLTADAAESQSLASAEVEKGARGGSVSSSRPVTICTPVAVL